MHQEPNAKNTTQDWIPPPQIPGKITSLFNTPTALTHTGDKSCISAKDNFSLLADMDTHNEGNLERTASFSNDQSHNDGNRIRVVVSESDVRNPLLEILNRLPGPFESKDEVMQTFFKSLLKIVNSVSSKDAENFKDEKLKKAESEIKKLKEKLAKSREDLLNSQETCTSLRKRYNRHEESTNRELEKLQKSLKEKEDLLKKQFWEITELKSKIQDAKSPSELQKKLKKSEENFRLQRTKATNFAIEAQELKAEIKLLKEEISSKDVKIQNVEKEKEILNCHIKQLEEVDADQRSKIISLEKELHDLNTDLAVRIDQMQQQRERIFDAIKASVSFTSSSSNAEIWNDRKLCKKRKSSDDESPSTEAEFTVTSTELTLPDGDMDSGAVPDTTELCQNKAISNTPGSMNPRVEAIPNLLDVRLVHPCRLCKAMFTKADDLQQHLPDCSKMTDTESLS